MPPPITNQKQKNTTTQKTKTCYTARTSKKKASVVSPTAATFYFCKSGTFSGTFSGTLLDLTWLCTKVSQTLTWLDPISLRCWGTRTKSPISREVTEAVLQVSYGLFSLQKFCIEVIQRRHQGPLVLKTFERTESWRIVRDSLKKKRMVLVLVIEIQDFYWFLNFRIIMITYIRHLWQKEMRLVADMILKLITYEDISHLLTACTFWSVIFPIVWVGQCSLYPFGCLRKGCTLLEIQNL